MAHIQKRCGACRLTFSSKSRKCPTCGGEPSYVARYRAPGGAEKSKSFPRAIDAERYITDQAAKVQRGEWVDPELGKVTFAEWSRDWLALKSLKPKTREGYEGHLRTHLLPAFGEKSLSAIQPAEVHRFVADMTASGSSPRTVRNAYRVLSAIMRRAVVTGKLIRTPCLEVELPKPARKEMRFLSAAEVARLAEAAGEWSPLVYFAAYSGLRFGEVAALRVGRVNVLRAAVEVAESASEVGGTVQYVAPKNGRTRIVSLPRFVAELLAPLVAGKVPQDLVFGPLRHGQFYRGIFQPATKAAKLEGLRFHDLRHTCAALSIEAGAHPRIIMERLGHSSIVVTTDIYGHLLPSQDEALTTALEAAHAKAIAEQSRDHGGTVTPLRAAEQGV